MGLVSAVSETHTGRGWIPANLVLRALLSVNLPSIRPTIGHLALGFEQGVGWGWREAGDFLEQPTLQIRHI